MVRWTGLHNPLLDAGYCLDPEFHAYIHRTEALTDLYPMCDKMHMKGAVKGAVVLAMLLQGKERRNVLKRQQMDKCSKDGSGGMVRNVCHALSS